jgi:GrpB-like predicted nucleotidyltransferase (UPF0157 family)
MPTFDAESVVVIEAYSASWPGAFAAERARLTEIFGLPAERMEHVGSTAIPGLAAKPVIDIMVGADSLDGIEACIPRAVAGGYRYVEEFNALIPERRYFEKANRIHVHAVAQGGPFWVRMLAFRDALRADASLRQDYESLKRRLAEAHRGDLAAYTDAKTPFIRSIERRHLEGQRRRLDDEIRHYPTPIPRCDAQFNHLYEQRARIVAAIEALAAGA